MAMLDPNNPNGWNTIHNGGPYHDLREIPIPTDLGSATDPSDSSVYIIENGASITLQDGVTVYDCTFKVKPGGSIINYDSKEVAGRFKIQWLDGSNNVVSTFTLHRGRVQKQLIELNNLTIDADVIFEADIIRAGDNVGVYVTPAGNRVVTFKGVNEVKLGANFQAKPRGNGTFYSYTGNRCNRNTSAKY
jgi:beta-galactosidase GanA